MSTWVLTNLTVLNAGPDLHVPDSLFLGDFCQWLVMDVRQILCHRAGYAFRAAFCHSLIGRRQRCAPPTVALSVGLAGAGGSAPEGEGAPSDPQAVHGDHSSGGLFLRGGA